jgi:hypothetical protein
VAVGSSRQTGRAPSLGSRFRDRYPGRWPLQPQALLAMRGTSLMVPGFCYGDPDGRVVAEIKPAIRMVRPGNLRGDLERQPRNWSAMPSRKWSGILRISGGGTGSGGKSSIPIFSPCSSRSGSVARKGRRDGRSAPLKPLPPTDPLACGPPSENGAERSSAPVWGIALTPLSPLSYTPPAEENSPLLL